MSNQNKLSKSAQSIQAIFSQKNLPLRVIELPASTRTANEAAVTIGCSVAQIVKSILFRTDKTNEPVLVLASGVNRIDENMIAMQLQEKINKADADFARAITGFAIGGIPPIGHKQKVNHIFIDEDLLTHKELWAAAGTPNAVFTLTPQDLVALTDGVVIKVSR